MLYDMLGVCFVEISTYLILPKKGFEGGQNCWETRIMLDLETINNISVKRWYLRKIKWWSPLKPNKIYLKFQIKYSSWKEL